MAAGLAFAAPAPTTVKPFTAYHDGDAIVFTPEITGTRRMASFGPWNLGERLRDGKPMDGRLNLYVVVPGTQYRSATKPEYNHNRIVNKYTVDGKVRDWDIYYCLIIDPKLGSDFRSENDLLMAAHQTFRPADRFDLSDVPSGEILRERLGMDSVNGLNKYRRRNRSLPRLLIIPAGLAVRATAELPDVTITHFGQPSSPTQ
ncbi:MAG TPA: hypothetical protein VFW31_14895 [Candidatus Angelobacter sp.]|nr:hypothetical protein [Candidatus Angelobacter sp.]